MKDKTIACELPELAADETRQRIQVFPGPGDYVHPSGSFSLTADSLSEFADSLNARDVPLDRDHSFQKGRGSKAAGWFVKGTAQVEATGVFADVEWTPTAADELRNREYRFISPEFAFGRREMDGRSVPEPTVLAAAITNRPFFKVMAPIAADDLSDDDVEAVEDEFGAEIAASLAQLDEDAARGIIAAAMVRVSFADPGYRKDGKQRYPLTSAEDVESAWKTISRKNVAQTYEAEQMSRIRARIKRAAKKFGVTIGADNHEEDGMDLTALAEAAGLAADATEADVAEAFKKIAADNKALEAKLADAPTNETIAAMVTKAVSDGVAASRKDEVLEKGVSELKIAAADMPHFATLYDLDPAGVTKILADMTPRLPATPAGRETTVSVGDDTVTADLSPVTSNGNEYDVDENRAKAHAAAEATLAKRGVTFASEGYEDAYIAEVEAQAKKLGLSLDPRDA